MGERVGNLQFGFRFGRSEHLERFGRRYCGSEVTNVRWRNRKLRARLQAKQTRSAKRRLKKLAGRESRFARHVNHCISKQIVRTAKGTE